MTQRRRDGNTIVDSYVEAYAGRDTPKDVPILLPLYESDAVFRDASSGITNQGVSGIEAALNTLLATPEFDLSIDKTLTGNGWAVLFWTADGGLPDSARVTQVAGITVLEISKDKIVRERGTTIPRRPSSSRSTAGYDFRKTGPP